jgi:two-component sensor histidine kinase
MERENVTVENGYRPWQPIGLDEILNYIGIYKIKTWALIIGWVILIGLSIYSVLTMLPQSWVSDNVEASNIQAFFLFYPPLILGTLLLFWAGFEWGFIPVFLSSFVIAFSANMPVYWALLFAFSFVLGLGIYALAYNCVPARIDLRGLKSITFFVVVSLIAAMASSLGSFVWSLQQGISPAMTVKIWNGWWTGAFFQSLLIIGPLLLIATPTVIRFRNRFLISSPRKEVTLGWIYSAIGSVVVIVSLFVIGGRILGTRSINQAIASADVAFAERILQATESYQLIFWISLGIILTVGLSGIYLVSTWNQILKNEVDEKTASLLARETELEQAVKEKDLLLYEIHGRVKNNLSIVLALFELQLKRTGDESLVDTLRDSKSRIRSISLIHELMSQTGTFKTLNLNSYVIKLTNRLNQDYRDAKNGTDIVVNAEDLILDVERAVPVCMVINEIISRVFEKSYTTDKTSNVSIDLYTDNKVFYVVVRENGNFDKSTFEWSNKKDLGIRLIRSLTKQIKGELLIDDVKNSIAIIFPNLLEEGMVSELNASLEKEIADS